MKDKSKKEQKRPLNPVLKYASLGTEMLAAVILGAWMGNWLDDYFDNATPYITLLGMLLGVVTSIVLLLRGLKKG